MKGQFLDLWEGSKRSLWSNTLFDWVYDQFITNSHTLISILENQLNLKIWKIICRLSLFKSQNSSYLWFTWFSSSKWQFRLKNSKLNTPEFSLVLISNIKIFIELFFRLFGPQGQPFTEYKAKGKELWPYAALKTRYLALFLVYY